MSESRLSGWDEARNIDSGVRDSLLLKSNNTDVDVGVLDFLAFCYRRKSIIAVIIGLTMMVFYGKFLVSERVYQSTALVVPVNQNNSNRVASMASQFSGLLGSSFGVQNTLSRSTQAIALMKSRAFLTKFIEKEKLFKDLLLDVWDEENQRWDVKDERKVPTIQDAIARFNDSLIVNEDPTSGLISVGFQHTNRKLAQRVVSNILIDINKVMAVKEKEKVSDVIASLYEALENAAIQEVRFEIYGLIAQQLKIQALATISTEYVFAVLDPPIVPDSDRHIRPRGYVFFLIVGFAVGCVLAIFGIFGWALMVNVIKHSEEMGFENSVEVLKKNDEDD